MGAMIVNFHSQTSPYADFAVLYQKSRRFDDVYINHLRELAAQCGLQISPMGDKLIIIHPEKLSAHVLDGFIFSGYAYLDGKYFTSAEIRERKPDERMLAEAVGDFTCIYLTDQKLSVFTDLFGLGIIHYFADDDLTFATNRPHLGARLFSRRLLPFRPNLDFLRMIPLQGRLTLQQPFNDETPVEGFRTLPLDRILAVDLTGQDTSVQQKSFFSTENLAQSGYSSLLQQAKNEMVECVTATVSSPYFDRFVCDLSGGKDSRMVLGAVLSAAEDVQTATRIFSRDLAGGRDLETATALAEVFDLKFEDGFEGSIERIDPVEAFSIWRSFFFGQYHRVGLPTFSKRGTSRTVHFAGGCGEAMTESAEVAWIRENIGDGSFSEALGKWMDKSFKKAFAVMGTEYASAVKAYVGRGLLDLDQKPRHDAINSFYLNYRNRVHFGLIHYPYYHDYLSVFPLMSKNLFLASKCLSEEDRAEGRIIFDILESFNPLLVQIPFANEFTYAERHRRRLLSVNGERKRAEWRVATESARAARAAAIKKSNLAQSSQDEFRRLVHLMAASALIDLQELFPSEQEELFTYSLKVLSSLYSADNDKSFFSYASYVLGIHDYFFEEQIGSVRTLGDLDDSRLETLHQYASPIKSAVVERNGSKLQISTELHRDAPVELYQYACVIGASGGELKRTGFQSSKCFVLDDVPSHATHVSVYARSQKTVFSFKTSVHV